jgi:hypothetical protein
MVESRLHNSSAGDRVPAFRRGPSSVERSHLWMSVRTRAECGTSEQAFDSAEARASRVPIRASFWTRFVLPAHQLTH